MKSVNVIFLIIFAVFFIVGCSDKKQEVVHNGNSSSAEEESANKKEDSKFKPGTFKPGNFEPGNFEPGTFEPGNFEPGTFKPGTFEPGNFDTNITISVEENEIVIDVPSHLLFDFDESQLKSDVIETLDQLSEDLNTYDGANVWINGHTDSQGNKDYNQKLSEDRAREVQSYLKKKVNAEKIHLETKGYGQTKPVASNETEEGREKNRRVEIVVEPLVKK